VYRSSFGMDCLGFMNFPLDSSYFAFYSTCCQGIITDVTSLRFLFANNARMPPPSQTRYLKRSAPRSTWSVRTAVQNFRRISRCSSILSAYAV